MSYKFKHKKVWEVIVVPYLCAPSEPMGRICVPKTYYVPKFQAYQLRKILLGNQGDQIKNVSFYSYEVNETKSCWLVIQKLYGKYIS